jgi:hypothetical protein
MRTRCPASQICTGRRRLSRSKYSLLRSDRPLVMPVGLDHPQCYITVALEALDLAGGRGRRVLGNIGDRRVGHDRADARQFDGAENLAPIVSAGGSRPCRAASPHDAAHRRENAAPRPGHFQQLLRLRHDPDIGLRRFPPLRIDRLGLVVADRTCNDDVFALLPVGRRRHTMFCGHL